MLIHYEKSCMINFYLYIYRMGLLKFFLSQNAMLRSLEKSLLCAKYLNKKIWKILIENSRSSENKKVRETKNFTKRIFVKLIPKLLVGKDHESRRLDVNYFVALFDYLKLFLGIIKKKKFHKLCFAFYPIKFSQQF